MPRTKPALGTFQRSMLAAITDPSAETVERFSPAILPSRRQSRAERLAVYRGAYVARLTECLAAEFPAFRRAVGEEAFAGLAAAYVARFPSRTYTLGRFADQFVTFLREQAEEVELPSGGVAAGTAEFLIDLARFERLRSLVFDGPGQENETKPARPRDPTPDLSARAVLTPSLRLATFRWPVQDFWRSVQRDDSATIPPRRWTRLAVWRRDFAVTVREFDHFEWRLLLALRSRAIGDALAAAARRQGDGAGLLPRVRRFFEAATRSGIVLSLH